MADIDNPSDTTGRLIAASKVNGTSVYNRGGEKLGSVYDVLIDKRSGKAAYAIMSFGGFLGLGEKYHPLPWKMLTYDTRLGGYVVDLDRDKLENAPSYGIIAYFLVPLAFVPLALNSWKSVVVFVPAHGGGEERVLL